MHIKHTAGLGRTLTGLAALALTAAPAAHAQTTVFSTFGTGGSFNTGLGYTESGPASSVGRALGFAVNAGAAFSPSATGALSTVTVAYFHVSGTDDAHLYLTDSFGSLGNTSASLASFLFTPPGGSGGTVVVSSAQHPVLTAGQTYYLYGLEPGNEWNGWNLRLPPVFGTTVGSRSDGSYRSFSNAPLPAFSVQESSTVPPESPGLTNRSDVLAPESSGLANLSGALLALGLGGLVSVVKKRKSRTP